MLIFILPFYIEIVNKFNSHYLRDNKLLPHPIFYAVGSLKIKQVKTEYEYIHVHSSHGDNFEKSIGAQIQ